MKNSNFFSVDVVENFDSMFRLYSVRAKLEFGLVRENWRQCIWVLVNDYKHRDSMLNSLLAKENRETSFFIVNKFVKKKLPGT